MSDIPDEHPIRAFVIESGNLKDGFQKACEHIAALEQRVEGLEKALYEAIEVGGAPESMWVDTDEETKRAWPIPDIDLEEALETLAAEEEEGDAGKPSLPLLAEF